ncbi:MAG: S-methyl-5-thioribose-1-phosphate isomerase [Bacteriovoracaceae bacterium]|jgi:methylthioribose-1-phosphate isomerase
MNLTDYRPLVWKDDSLILLDQRYLPLKEDFVTARTIEDAFMAIKDMVVRGAPCIGFTGIFGMALWIHSQSSLNESKIIEAGEYLKSSRPTAVNLMYEVDRAVKYMVSMIKENQTKDFIYKNIIQFAHDQITALEKKNQKMADYAAEELKRIYGDRPLRLMTHCNTGFLACGCIGTALGVISNYNKLGKVEQVWVDETRPYMQGTRLTAFELTKEKIPFKIVVEGAASYLMKNKKVDAIFVGADRIVANGDTANKVGTSTLSIVAKHYGIPFFVVAPISSFDTTLPDGTHIEIEMRPDEEITHFKGHQVAPYGASTENPSFDVTDHEMITGIICENGLIRPENKGHLLQVVKG